VDLGGLDRLLEGHRRQNRGQPLGEHRLARAGRPDHQDVVTAGCRDLERALGLLLSFDLAEIDVVNVGVAERRGEINRNRLERTQALEEFESLAQALDSEHRRALSYHGSLRGIFAREHHALEFGRSREQRGRQRTLDPLDTAVEREFTENQVATQALAILEHVLRSKNSKRQRQIECRALFARICRREVDSHLTRWEIEAGIFQRRLDPIERLLDRALGQADETMRRYSGADVDFDFDRKRVNPNQRARYYACMQQPPSTRCSQVANK
jgi:hypothetical protein